MFEFGLVHFLIPRLLPWAVLLTLPATVAFAETSPDSFLGSGLDSSALETGALGLQAVESEFKPLGKATSPEVAQSGGVDLLSEDPPVESDPDVDESTVTYGDGHETLLLNAGHYHESPKRYALSFAAGTTWFDNGDMATYFEPWTRTFKIEMSRQYWNQLQIGLDVCLIKDVGNNASTEDVDGDGVADESSDTTELRLLPVGLGVTYRADYSEEQSFVPYVSGGIEVAYVKLVTDQSSLGLNDQTEVGHRIGGYVGGGVEFLLDSIEPTRAADLELTSGINDSYLVLDVRYHWLQWYYESGQIVEDTSTPSAVFNGIQLTAGLKFDF